MRKEIVELVSFGKIPASEDNAEIIKAFDEQLKIIETPINAEEALALAKLFTGKEEDAYGLT